MMALLYDCKLHRPGCVLLQALYGGDRRVVLKFDARHWLVDLTPDMRLYRIQNWEQVGQLVRLTEARNPKLGGAQC
jgi:hypothetical protein